MMKRLFLMPSFPQATSEQRQDTDLVIDKDLVHEKNLVKRYY